MFAAHNMLLANAKKAAVTYKGAAAALTTSVAIPSHSVGDMIIIYAQCHYLSTLSKPSAGGTVPAWTDIAVQNGVKYQSYYMAYAIATATDTTTGTWTNAQTTMAIVVSGQGASPIGGKNSTQQSTTSPSCPSVTLSNTSGSSLLLHIGCMESGAYYTAAFSQAGYTGRLTPSGDSSARYRLFTKNDTTTDGSVATGTTTSSPDSRTTTLEILA